MCELGWITWGSPWDRLPIQLEFGPDRRPTELSCGSSRLPTKHPREPPIVGVWLRCSATNGLVFSAMHTLAE